MVIFHIIFKSKFEVFFFFFPQKIELEFFLAISVDIALEK
jgi:hypothetical protein